MPLAQASLARRVGAPAAPSLRPPMALRAVPAHPGPRLRSRPAPAPAALFGGPPRPSSPAPRAPAEAAAGADANRGATRLFLDSASVLQWDQWAKTGMLYGFTTNPSILLRDGVPACNAKVLGVLASQAWNLGARELHLQAWGESASKLYSTGLDLAGIDPRIVVKVPATRDGVEAAALLKAAGAAVTLTGLFAAHQALAAAAVGADYAAPYLGRIGGGGRDGRQEVVAMQSVVENLDARTRILVASIRDAEDIVVLATQGCNTFTVSPAVAASLFAEPGTAAAAEEFERAAAALGAP